MQHTEVKLFDVQQKYIKFKNQGTKYQPLVYFLGNSDKSFHPKDSKEVMAQSGQDLSCEG